MGRILFSVGKRHSASTSIRFLSEILDATRRYFFTGANYSFYRSGGLFFALCPPFQQGLPKLSAWQKNINNAAESEKLRNRLQQ